MAGSLIDPSTIANEHIRAHAEEGLFFRTIVEDAGLEPATFPAKELMHVAVRQLRRGERGIRVALAAMGRTVGSPWRADEKSAALAAWLALADTVSDVGS